MKIVYLTLLFFYFQCNSFCQTLIPDSLKVKNYIEVEPFPGAANMSSVAQSLPMYPGGKDGILKHIENNTVYPNDAIDQKIEGTVTIKYFVDTLGNITDITVVKSVSESLDNEAIRVISTTMDKWLPATQRNKPIKVAFTQDVVFKLPAKKKKQKK